MNHIITASLAAFGAFLSSAFAILFFARWVSRVGPIIRPDGATEGEEFSDPHQLWLTSGIVATLVGIGFGLISHILMTDQKSIDNYVLAIVVTSTMLTVIFKKTGRMRSS